MLDWSQHYSPQPEIWEYIRKVARKYELYSKIQFNTTVKSLTWEEDKKKWRVVTVSKLANENEGKEKSTYFDIV